MQLLGCMIVRDDALVSNFAATDVVGIAPMAGAHAP